MSGFVSPLYVVSFTDSHFHFRGVSGFPAGLSMISAVYYELHYS